MDIDRRTFLKMGGVFAVGSIAFPGSQMLYASAQGGLTGEVTSASSKNKWGMVVDLDKCNGCKVCETVCREENNVPFWNEPSYDAYWIRVAEVKQDRPGLPAAQERPIPLLCAHCDDPPCAHVCPTKATFKREDGLVLIDEHRCIGCRYCVIACPYHARSMIFRDNDVRTNKDVPKLMRGVASKCTFCVHRIDDGRLPACVEKCPHNALSFGNLKDASSHVGEVVESGKTGILRPNLRVGPNVYYYPGF